MGRRFRKQLKASCHPDSPCLLFAVWSAVRLPVNMRHMSQMHSPAMSPAGSKFARYSAARAVPLERVTASSVRAFSRRSRWRAFLARFGARRKSRASYASRKSSAM